MAVRVQRLQPRDGDELALRELEHVVASVHIDELIRTDLGHDVAGLVVTVRVEHRRGDVRPLVVAEHDAVRLDEQLAARIGLVGLEVTELGHVVELVVDDRRTHDAGVANRA